MPIVDTSVAVATPSTTAARIKNGSARAGSATTKLRAISRVVARLTLLRSSPRYLQRITKHNKHASTTAGKSPPVKSAAIETARYRADGNEDQARRNCFGLRPGCRQQRDQISGFGSALPHFWEKHRRHRRHVGSFRAGNSGDQIHAANQNEMQPASDMANEIGQEANQGAGHAGHFDEKAEEHEQRNGEQNQVAHA